MKKLELLVGAAIGLDLLKMKAPLSTNWVPSDTSKLNVP